MATYKHDGDFRQITAGADLVNGTIVQTADGLAGIVEGLAGIKNGKVGNVRVDGIVTCDKASATVIAAGDRLQLATATQLVTVKASGAADAGNIIIGRAALAAGNGTTTVDIDLNRAAV
jgi:predicted RecA/RadA family phage recombinase